MNEESHDRWCTDDVDRVRGMAKARAELMRRAEALGVKPMRSLEDFAGEPALIADFDVDEFLRHVWEERGSNSGGKPPS